MIFLRTIFQLTKTSFVNSLVFTAATLILSCGPNEIQTEIIETNLGEKFYIELASNQSAGYSWVWANKAEATKVDTSSVIYEVTKTRSSGEIKIEFWSFDALEKGEELIIMEYTLKGSEKKSNRVIHYQVQID